MKSSILIILFLIVHSGNSQVREIPNLDFENINQIQNDYIKLLKLKDSNSLIIKITYGSGWHRSNSKFIVYDNHGKVFLFETINSKCSSNKLKIRKLPLKNSKQYLYWEFLNRFNNASEYQIDKTKLNITQRTIDNGMVEDKLVEETVIYDGHTITFEITQFKKNTIYSSYSPEEYIKMKYPGMEERQKLLNLIKTLEELLKNH
ncbi:MAG: hypothetical protein LKG19_12375 [Saprospiraceae bacterium]|jgi:hypothetical protein|nr:hypothetical protein [Saprospiraceae bacterium]